MTRIIEATPEERAYNEGWNAYFSGQGVNINPYNPESEVTLYEGFNDGWSTAQRGDKIMVEFEDESE